MSEEHDRIAHAAWYVAAGYPREALDVLRSADPNDVKALYWRARALADLGRTEEAEDAARRALEREPENVDVLLSLATLQLGRGNAWEAEGTVRKAIELAPEKAEPFGVYVLILLEQKRYEWAEKMLERMMQLAPDDEATLRIRTYFLLQAATSAKARAAARELLRAYPDEAYAHYLQGLASLSGRWWRGLRHLRQAAAMRPQDPLLTETARVMHAWYMRLVWATSGVVHYLLAVAVFAAIVAGLVRNDEVPMLPVALFVGLAVFKVAAPFFGSVSLNHRVRRAQREL